MANRTFIGRTDILEKIYKVLYGYETNKIVLYGSPYIGKTSILLELLKRLPEVGAYSPLYINLKDKKIKFGIGLDESVIDNFSVDDLPSSLDRLLDTIPPNSDLILLMDGYDDEVFEGVIRRDQVQLQFIFVVDSKPGNNICPLLKNIESHQITCLNEEDTGKFVKSKDSSLNQQDLLDQIWMWTGGHPFLIQELCAVIEKPEDDIKSVISEILEHINGNKMERICKESFPDEREIELIRQWSDKYKDVNKNGKRIYHFLPIIMVLFVVSIIVYNKGWHRKQNYGKTDVIEINPVLVSTDNSIIEITDIDILSSEDEACQIWSVAFSENGKLLAAGLNNGKILVWNVSDLSKPKQRFDKHTNGVKCVTFDPEDQNFLASGSLDNTVKLWDLTNGKIEKNIDYHKSWVLNVAFSPDGKYLASRSKDGIIAVWNLNEEMVSRPMNELEYDKGQISVIAFHPDKKNLIIFASMDGNIRLWELALKKSKPLSLYHKNYLLDIIAFPTGKRIASASSDAILLWDTEHYKAKQKINIPLNDIISIVFNSDASLIALGSYDSTFLLYDIGKKNLLSLLKLHEKNVISMAFSSKNNLLASVLEDGTICLWKIKIR